MGIYLGVLILSITNYLKNSKMNTFLFFLFFAISAFRWEVGTDFDNYLLAYYKVRDFGIGSIRFEVLNKLIYLIATLFRSERFYYFITTVIVFLFFYKILRDFKGYGDTIILMFLLSNFYFFSFNGIRQAIAIIIFLYSSKYILKRKWKKYFFCIILGSFFHLSLIIMLPLYFYRKIEIKRKLQLISILLISLIFKEFFTYFLSIIALKIDYFSYYSRYFLRETALKGFSAQAITKIFRNFILIAIILLNKHRYKNSFYYNEMFKMYYLGTVMFNLLPGFLVRLSFPLFYYEIIFTSVMLNKTKDKLFKNIVIAFYLAKFLAGLYVGTNGVIPYKIY